MRYKAAKANCTLVQARVEGPVATATPPADPPPASADVAPEPAPEPLRDSEDLAAMLFPSLRPDAPAADVD